MCILGQARQMLHCLFMKCHCPLTCWDCCSYKVEHAVAAYVRAFFYTVYGWSRQTHLFHEFLSLFLCILGFGLGKKGNRHCEAIIVKSMFR